MAGEKEDPLLEVTPDSKGNVDVTQAVLALAMAESASADKLEIA